MLPCQCLRWQFSEKISVPGRKATQLLNIPAMGRIRDRTSGLGLCDNFVAYAMQSQFLNIGIRGLIEHDLECAMQRSV